MLVLLFLTMAMPNTTTPLHLLPNTQIFTCIPTLSGSILLAGPPSTFIIAVRMGGPPRYSGLHHDNVENYAQEMVSHLVVLYRSPCSTSLSPPSYHCPLLPITVPSFPSLSPPPHHCPLRPITVPSFPSLSPSFPSLSPPPHHIMLSWQIVFLPLLSRYSLLPPIWSVKKNS